MPSCRSTTVNCCFAHCPLFLVCSAASAGASNAYHLRLSQLQVSIPLSGPRGQPTLLSYSQAATGVAPALVARHRSYRRDRSEPVATTASEWALTIAAIVVGVVGAFHSASLLLLSSAARFLLAAHRDFFVFR
uniref:Secreted protein n=1 Tax=Ascaris lumbricoides TaxID=6252 RepID=A0A0M3HNE7_ASCLU